MERQQWKTSKREGKGFSLAEVLVGVWDVEGAHVGGLAPGEGPIVNHGQIIGRGILRFS